jgi:ATP-binding cassette subfamily C (CFTR/MRP) protein 1
MLRSIIYTNWLLVNKTGKHILALTTLATFQGDFWAAVVPRLCFTGFSFAQPFLINTIIDTLGSPRSENANGVTGGLVGATALVYLGIAVGNRDGSVAEETTYF